MTIADKKQKPQVVLTDLQKNVAVRLVMGEKVIDITKEFHISAQTIAKWLKLPPFHEFKESLSSQNRELAMAYLQSKQMKWLGRLDQISEQSVDIKVARQASVDLLGFAGMENKNVPAPPSMINNNINITATEDEIDDELAELDNMLGDTKEEPSIEKDGDVDLNPSISDLPKNK